MLTISFDHGSIVIPSEDWTSEAEGLIGDLLTLDHRTSEYRATAQSYAEIVLILYRRGIAYEDRSKSFLSTNWLMSSIRSPRPYQSEGLSAWVRAGRKGVVVLPTGAGKSYLAMMAMNIVKRSTLIVVPTLDLVSQWASDLEACFGIQPCLWGGGVHETGDITVSTYDSAQIHMEREGDRFGFLIFDECHHLPGPSYRWISKMSVAPYRLGLSATPERSDGGEFLLNDLIGPICYRVEIHALKGEYLSDYDTELIEVPLEDEELIRYRSARSVYTNFIKKENLDFSSLNGWQDFLELCFKSEEGREAYSAYLEQKKIVRESSSKLKVLWQLLLEHRHRQVLIFTNDNATAYRIGEQFLLPVLTHQTRLKERKKILSKFKEGEWPWLVTSKVLNEGVDVPNVSVGIVVSGSGSTREHVQRLGRILRMSDEGKARLIELVSSGTSETGQSQRRRDHVAYSN
jgi:superfamily II DNA or RNA helicase